MKQITSRALGPYLVRLAEDSDDSGSVTILRGGEIILQAVATERGLCLSQPGSALPGLRVIDEVEGVKP